MGSQQDYRYGPIAELVKAPPFKVRDPRFESEWAHKINALIVQRKNENLLSSR